MRGPSPSAHFRRLAVVAGALVSLGRPARAQGGGDGFLFSVPRGSLSVRVGMNNPTARSDLFDFTTDTLTLNRSDFAAVSAAIDFSFATQVRFLDAFVSVGYAGSKAPSEFRNWVDLNDQPIEQTTMFQRLPITAGVKAYLAPRGREIGHFAWVPSRIAPYVGAGAGLMWYRFRQEGDFVDFQTLDVFGAKFESDGWGPIVQGMAGVDVTVTPRMSLTADARYVHSDARVSGDFSGFDKLDLSALTTSLGLTFRF